MEQVRGLCKAHGIAFGGRVTKLDLYYLVCQRFGIFTSGASTSGESQPSLEKPPIPGDVYEAYKKLPSFPHITSGWSVAALCKIPFFDLASVTDYLINSADKAFDGESLRCYKQLRAYQLFDERHVHNVEANLWEKGEHFFFVRAQCWPSQDTSKASYKCTVCIDRKEGRCYGGHCRCVSGLGEACSHIAGLLFAIEDFCCRGMRSLCGPSVTEIICRWCEPCKQKVDPVPLSDLAVAKAEGSGRRRKRWTRKGISFYDPRHPDDRGLDQTAKAELKNDMLKDFGDCGFLRHLYDADDSGSSPSDVPDVTLTDHMSWDCPEVAFAREVTVASVQVVRTEPEALTLCDRRRTALYDAIGVIFVEDGETVRHNILEDAYEKLLKAEKLSSAALLELELATRLQHQSPRWLAEHVGRITSSSAHKIFRRRSTTQPDKIVSAIMSGFSDGRDLRDDDLRAHGHRMEETARTAYITSKAKSGSAVTVSQNGLFVDKELPFLAASTDGIIREEGIEGKGVLEIKSPASTQSVADLCQARKGICLRQDAGGELHLKTTHPYFTQLQMEMALTGCSWADFVVYTSEACGGLFVERVAFDVKFWEKCCGVLKDFYQKFVVLELVTRRLKHNKKLLAQ